LPTEARSPSSSGDSRHVPLPDDVLFALHGVPFPGAVASLALALEAAVAGRACSPAATAALADALTRALAHLGTTPGRFIAMEDDVARALLALHAEPSAVERVLTDLDEMYIARWE